MSFSIEFKNLGERFEVEIEENGEKKVLRLPEFFQNEKINPLYRQAVAKLKEIALSNGIDISEIIWAFGENSPKPDISIENGTVLIDETELNLGGLHK